jgi:hypothetical protein
MTRPDIIAAYERHEKAKGGLAYADVQECLRLAAEECGVTVQVAREALIEAWAGLRG